MPTPHLASRTITLALVLLLALIAALGGALIQTLRAQQALVTDLAELNDVEYGLLNAEAWVEQLTAVAERTIDRFELTPENRPVLKANLERILHVLISEADRQFSKPPKGKGLQRFKKVLKQRLREALIDMDEVRRDVPAYADRLLDEMNKPRTREELKTFLKNLLTDVSASTFANIDRSRLHAVHARYQCADRAGCTQIIQPRIDATESRALRLTAPLLGLVLLLFLLVCRVPYRPGRLALLPLCCTVLMLCGVLTPMLEIEARITELEFELLGERVAFSNQILYFQNKSVLDVVAILGRTGKPEMVLVSVLLVLFSVLFPLAKLLASLIHLHGSAARSRLVEFFAFKSGKWSMADVFVVAMFMAFIGFRGLATKQLEEFAEAGGGEVKVLTTNGTSLELGFYLFLAFCLANLVTSTLIEARAGSGGEAVRHRGDTAGG